MNAPSNRKLTALVPYAIGAVLVVQFVALGVWQIGRGMDKRADRAEFGAEIGFSQWQPGSEVRAWQKIEVRGDFVAERQFLLENIIIESRYGDYVLTPLDVGNDEPLLIVNRGWIERRGNTFEPRAIDLDTASVRVRGRVGALPRAGYRMGEAVTPGTGWPKPAVYPTLEELAAALGQPLQPFVLLLDPEEPHGFYRHWAPTEMGPARHFAYALQWFAMGIVLAGLLVWNYRKRGFES